MKPVVLLLFILLLTSASTIKMDATSCYRFEWRNTSIEVNVNDPISLHDSKPSAQLYCGISPVHDADITYIKGVDYTTMSTVTTGRVGTYNVYYKAYSTTYKIKSVHRITFFVVDKEAPEFVRVPQFSIEYGSPLPDLTYGLSYQDNHDTLNELSLSIDTSHVFPGLGTYPIFYTLIDKSGNRSTQASTITIEDTTPPVVRLLRPIKVNIADTAVDYLDYFMILDSVDQTDVLVVIDDTQVDYHNFGVYSIEISATDKTGNTSTANVDVLVTDTEAPTITLSETKIEIDLFETINYYSFIEEVRDNVSVLSTSEIVVDVRQLDASKIGSYKVTYHITDDAGNKGVSFLIVWVRPSKDPELRIENQTILRNQAFNPYTEIKAFAYDDVDITSSIQILENGVKTSIPGIYYVTYAVFDDAGNYSQKTITVEVVDALNKGMPYNNTLQIIQYISYSGFAGIMGFTLYKRYKKKQENKSPTSHTYL